MHKIRKSPTGSDCLIVLSEEFIAVSNGYVCAAPLMEDKGILELVQRSKNIIDADSDDEKGMNNAVCVSTSSEMRNVMTSMHFYLDIHSNGEKNNKVDDTEHLLTIGR
ncbi:hypothetical protein TNCV_2136581 [Trichonephila clavipes]|nr:hypothetical protein TNCV_2136581 [Trichonephila clavipes]